MDTAPYWAGFREKRLVLQVCKDTGRFQHVPRPISIYTGSRNLDWREVSGRGTLLSWTVPRIALPDAPTTPIDRVQALIDLDEDVRLLALVAGTGPGSLTVGQRVRIDWSYSELFPNVPVFVPD